MQCESQTLELKAAHEGCPGKLYDTLSAFSNQDTGGNSYEAFRKKYQDDIRVNERADMTAIEIPKMEHYVDTIKDRIEIRNPGGLYGRMSLDTLGKPQTVGILQRATVEEGNSRLSGNIHDLLCDTELYQSAA